MFEIEYCLADITYFAYISLSFYYSINRCLQQPWKKDGVCNMSKRRGLCSERLPYQTVCIDKMEVLTRYLTWPWTLVLHFFSTSYFSLLQQDLIGSTMETSTRPCIWDAINMGSYHPQGYLTIFKWSTTLPQQSQLIHASHSVNKTATNSWLWGLVGNSSIVCVETS